MGEFHRPRTACTVLIAICGLLLAGCGGSSNGTVNVQPVGPNQAISVTDLGLFNTYGQTMINDGGTMVGAIRSPTLGTYYADSWPMGGHFSGLPGPGLDGSKRGLDTEATSINAAGVTAGSEYNANTLQSIPVVWQNLQYTQLIPGPTNYVAYTLTSINASDGIVGYNGLFSSQEAAGYYWQGFLSTPVALGPAHFAPFMINDNGVVVGGVVNGTSVQFYKLNINQGSVATTMGFSAPSSLTTSNPGVVINDAGTIAVCSGTSHNLIYISAGGQQTQVGANVIPEGINQKGDVVGTYATSAAGGFIYTTTKGLVNLNSYLASNSGWNILSAYSINDQGQVLAQADSPTGLIECVLLQLPSGDY
jgi:hypothetical protein